MVVGWVAACALGASIAAAAEAPAGLAPPAPVTPQDLPPEQATLTTLFSDRAHPYFDWEKRERHVELARRYYEAHGWRLAWSRNRTATPQARQLVEILRRASEKGLDARDYDGIPLTYALIDLMTTPSAEPGDWALWDAGLTVALARFLADLHYGRVDPADVGHGIQVDRDRLDIVAVITGLTQTSDPTLVIADSEPGFRHYELLKAALPRYRELALDERLTALPELPSRSLKQGDAYAGAEALRRLLIAVGDLPATAPAADGTYSASLFAGVKSFQERHGLEVDGVLGGGTFRELTTPLRQRVQQMELTLERWRWLPSKLDTPPIIVNIPQFKLFAFYGLEDDPDRMLIMDVIVGKAYRDQHTPVFAGDMSYLIFRPYWEVPYSITVKELLPQIRANPGYLERGNYEIVRGWSENTPALSPTPDVLRQLVTGQARIRQKPGPTNSLGAVKFMLPNRYNVYLHDTPTGYLFSRAERAFSHGCVRVSDPPALADFVLRNDPKWTPPEIATAMQKERPTQVNLKQKIRVFFVYGTALATRDKVYFFRDIYEHDRELAAFIARQRRG